MKVTGIFKLMGVESQSGFKDPTQINYVVGLAQGMDSLRMYLDANEFALYKDIPPYSDVEVVLDYNPVAKEVRYSMHLVTMAPVKASATATGK
jgi:hypothetical protein